MVKSRRMGVGLPVVGELHPGAAAIGLDVMAERGDFVGRVIGDHRDRAMVDAGRMNGSGQRAVQASVTCSGESVVARSTSVTG